YKDEEMGKEEDFERLWEGKGNKLKAIRFRNKIMQKVRQKGYEPTKENCKSYWLGGLKEEL
ncbi:MAG: hypothetical protein AB1779_10610, partial [Candidatus Thermoplasmatota archaeon]